MIRRRRTPRLAVLDDKLYAFGGVADRSLFAEVYDPIVDKWEALPQPSPTIRDNACFAAPLHGMKKIAVGDTLIWNAKTYLLHMGGDTFCMLWRSPSISQTKTQYHCTQLHVIKEEVSEEGSRGVLNARVLACQSFITPGKASICEAQTLGISLIEDNRQDEAIASLEVIGKNGGKILEMRTPQTTVV
ncbi:uncharacterized protein LOC126707066 [Quercus robur]|uniref:uncharacterized protein LOC126707066 n=1 Tax=Quercus robur TaxID=38942 RepID=UPI0021613D4E|nr:uncharacterized protein LOC126707066 [Quercus robur]